MASGGLIWGIMRVLAKNLYLTIKFYLDTLLYGKRFDIIMIYGLHFAINRVEIELLGSMISELL